MSVTERVAWYFLFATYPTAAFIAVYSLAVASR